MNPADFKIDDEIQNVNGAARGPVSFIRVSDSALIHDDTINLRSEPSRRRFCKAVAGKLDLSDAGSIEALLLDRLKQHMDLAKQPAAPKVSTTDALLAETPAEVREDALEKLRDPDLIGEIQRDLRAMGVAGNGVVAFATYLIGTSRLLSKPLAGIARGASSSGKSFEIETAAALFPPEAKLQAHHLSPKALLYMPDDALVHKFVVAGERNRRQDDNASDSTKFLREMLSSGTLTGCVAETVDGRLSTTRFEKPGPIAYVESSSAATIFAEDLNRCILLYADEGERQTRSIIAAAARAAAGEGGDEATVLAPIHHTMQRLLQPFRVIIPFAPQLAEKFPVARVEARRALPHLLNTIRAVALLRQFQKRDQAGKILADDVDYAVALTVIRPSLARLAGGDVDHQVYRVWKAVSDHSNGQEFTRTDAALWSGVRESDAGGRLQVLAEQGHVAETQEHRGNKPAKFKVVLDAPDEEPAVEVGLPTVDEVRDMVCAGGSPE